MIKPNKVQEWIEEIETRPLAAPFIVRTLSARVMELDKINEELRAENISLRSGVKLEEYERRIAELEYQIELLKRQVSEGSAPAISAQALLLIFDAEGRIAALEFSDKSLVHNQVLASLRNFTPPHRDDIHLLASSTQDELLFLYDSGRIDTKKAGDLKLGQDSALDWSTAFQMDMRSGERLIDIFPISDAPIKESCVQISRKGLARRISKDYFQTFLQERSIGKGVRSASDQPLNLALADSEDIYVLISRSGYISATTVQRLSIMLEEQIRLDMQDYLVSAFTLLPEQKLFIILDSGENYLQENPWTDPENADGSKRRLLPGGARAGGVQILGGGAAKDQDWVFCLTSRGEIRMIQLESQSRQKGKQGSALVKDTGQLLTFSLWKNQGNEA